MQLLHPETSLENLIFSFDESSYYFIKVFYLHTHSKLFIKVKKWDYAAKFGSKQLSTAEFYDECWGVWSL